MTSKEALKILNIDRLTYCEEEADKFMEAYNMAIKALEHEKALEEAFNIALLYGKEKGMEAIDKALYQMGMDGIKEQEIKASDRTCHTCKHYLSGERDGSCGSYICKGYSNWESEDAISRQAVLNTEYQVKIINDIEYVMLSEVQMKMRKLPPVNPQPKTGHCKDCKYFEYDSVARLDGIPLIMAHEVCSRWGDGCKTKEDGYCFLFEPKKGSDKE